jgi:hypothetical protein
MKTPEEGGTTKLILQTVASCVGVHVEVGSTTTPPMLQALRGVLQDRGYTGVIPGQQDLACTIDAIRIFHKGGGYPILQEKRYSPNICLQNFV